MEKPSYGDGLPIYALATPLAESALAVVRTAGSGEKDGDSPGAIELLAEIFSRPEKLLSAPGNSVVHGWIVGQGEAEPERKKIDEVLVAVYRAPRSYTGEDGADISCHGGIATVKAVFAALKKAGFREALPGEFTFRAFMNGKLDLTRCESVMELVAAKTGRGREHALRRLSGALEREISGVKALLVEVLAGAEIYLDYSEDEFFGPDDDEKAGRLPGLPLVEQAAVRLKKLSELWRRERVYADAVLAVLAGRPNAGKSSLFNCLLGEDRSIVTETPGTTRDWIEALVSINDIPLRLTDTAGIRNLNTEAANEAERIGVERSFELLEQASLVLYVVDGALGIGAEDRDFFRRYREAGSAKPFIIIWNKADLAMPPPLPEEELPGRFLALSAKTGEGIPVLTHTITELLEVPSSGIHGEEGAGPGTLRQKELVDSALASVEEALSLADRGEPLDIIAPLFRSAVDALGEITGEVFTADILEAMFSRFCVGK